MANIRVAINALSGRVGGGVTGFRHLLPALDGLGSRDEFHVIVSRTQTAIRRSIPDGFRIHRIPIDSASTVQRAIFEQLVLPLVLLKWRIDVLYSVGNITSLLAPCPVVLLMENANPHSDQAFTWSRRERIQLGLLRILGALSARRAKKIRFVSEDSRVLFCARLGIPRERTDVIYHGRPIFPVDGKSRGEIRGALPSRYILTVTTLAPHKNIERLMSAFCRLVEKDRYEGDLVIVGPSVFRGCARVLEAFKSSLAYQARIHFPGEKAPEELAALYGGADVFVMVSLEETFGLPVVEAMGCGVPVVAGKCPRNGRAYFNPFEEICGDSAVYCNPLDEESIAEVLHSVIADPTRRREMIESGHRRAADFDWNRTAARLHGLFRDAAKGTS